MLCIGGGSGPAGPVLAGLLFVAILLFNFFNIIHTKWVWLHGRIDCFAHELLVERLVPNDQLQVHLA